MDDASIIVQKASVHNLKGVSCSIPHGTFTCLTGVSGSGKSSFAFDTIFVEGQRRYVESLSHQAKRVIGNLPKPDVESITGLTPTISIEQKTGGLNPRSTVGTLTEIYDFLRLLFARVGTAFCPVSHERLTPQSKEEILKNIFNRFFKKKIIILSPWAKEKKGTLQDDLDEIEKKGFSRVRLDGEVYRISDLSNIDPTKEHTLDVVIDRVDVTHENKIRVHESSTTALELGKGMLYVQDVETQEEEFFSEFAYSKKSNLSYPPLEPHLFSFNSPSGMCPHCHGLGSRHEFILEKIIDPKKSIQEDACSIATSYKTVRYQNIYDNLARIFNFSVDTPWEKLSEKAKEVFLYGAGDKWLRMVFIHPRSGATWYDTLKWKGVIPEAWTRYSQAKSERFKQSYESLMHQGTCTFCKGSRLQPYPAACKLFDKTISELSNLPIFELRTFIEEKKDEVISWAQDLVHQILSRLLFLEEVGLKYLSLDRAATTLSGGEFQRVRLASHIGSGLVGVTYILDEPSIGLHAIDNDRLIESLHRLRDKGNTVLVVEHDKKTILSADHIIDFGKGAGQFGGSIIYEGSVKGLEKETESLTSDYLFERKSIAKERPERKPSKERIVMKGATLHNLKNVDLELPLGLFIAVTGVSGSGKSSLLLETLYPAISNKLMHSILPEAPFRSIEGLSFIDKVVEIDQSPIGKNSRSNPATYTKVFDAIRTLFASLPESLAKGFKSGRFSFNVQEGSCQECKGMGLIKVDMDFLECAFVECPICKGERFDNETLQIRYKGKTIQDVLSMTVQEALEFFSNIPSIKKGLHTLAQVGLDYLTLAQSSATLSGGESQRLKLSKNLSRPEAGKTLYILDEPTTGMHFHDIKNLVNILETLVDKGNTVVVIEHNIELIATADWVIDMGPGSGEEGGRIIYEGPPSLLAKKDTPTGKALQEHILHTEVLPSFKKKQKIRDIEIVGARQNTLKNLTLTIPRNELSAIIGPSGSGKSSLAFETLFAEGQRRYVESLSPYARQFVKQMPKSQVEIIHGVSPSVAIEQRGSAWNPRSTVGTITEIYDFFRILFARIGIPHCPKTGEPIQAISKQSVVDAALSWDPKSVMYVLAPRLISKQHTLEQEIQTLLKEGTTRVRYNNEIFDLSEKTPKAQAGRTSSLEVVVDRLLPTQENEKRLLSSIQEASILGQNRVILVQEKKEQLFNLSFSVPSTGESYPEITSKTFAFNTKEGMCPECKGLGFQWGLDLNSLPLSPYSSLEELFSFLMGESWNLIKENTKNILHHLDIDIHDELISLPSEKRKLLLQGSSEIIPSDDPRFFFEWLGLNTILDLSLRYQEEDFTETSSLKGFMRESPCPSCKGSRLHPLARAVTIQDRSIDRLSSQSIDDVLSWMRQSMKTTKKDKHLLRVTDEIQKRLEFVQDIGLGYLSLDRAASTLSGGEAQRIRLASQIGSGLSGILYVLDEPSIGLHPKDSKRLIQAFKRLKELNNTLVIVDHDPEIIMNADHIIELGPKGGKEGGHIIFQGSTKKLLSSSSSLTQPFLTKKEPLEKCVWKEKGPPIVLSNVSLHNVNNLTVSIPTEAIVGIIGVSGSGKSTLLFDVIEEAMKKRMKEPFPKLQQDEVRSAGDASISLFDASNGRGHWQGEKREDCKSPQAMHCCSLGNGSKECYDENAQIQGLEQFQAYISIDQKPMGQTNRSDIASYVDIMTPLRLHYAGLKQAKALGLEGKHFSPFHRKGMCSSCFGLGYKRIEMYYLPPVQVICPECKGLRLNAKSLSCEYKGKNFGQALETSVLDARELFDSIGKITRPLDRLLDLGLHYLPLGQQIATLSNGEAQRVKIAKEITKTRGKKTLFLIDEPTTGLHMGEVVTIMNVFRKLQEKGHTLLIIEHNIDLIKSCDYLIELGPGAGLQGGKIIAQGSPYEVKAMKNSVTGIYL